MGKVHQNRVVGQARPCSGLSWAVLGEGKDSQVLPAKICPVLHCCGWKSKRQRVVMHSEHCNSLHSNTIITRCLGDYFSVEKKMSSIGGCWGEQEETVARNPGEMSSLALSLSQPPNNVIFISTPFVRAHFPCKEIKSAQLQFMQQGIHESLEGNQLSQSCAM